MPQDDMKWLLFSCTIRVYDQRFAEIIYYGYELYLAVVSLLGSLVIRRDTNGGFPRGFPQLDLFGSFEEFTQALTLYKTPDFPIHSYS